MPPPTAAFFAAAAALATAATILTTTIAITTAGVLTATNWEIDRDIDRRVASSELRVSVFEYRVASNQ